MHGRRRQPGCPFHPPRSQTSNARIAPPSVKCSARNSRSSRWCARPSPSSLPRVHASPVSHARNASRARAGITRLPRCAAAHEVQTMPPVGWLNGNRPSGSTAAWHTLHTSTAGANPSSATMCHAPPRVASSAAPGVSGADAIASKAPVTASYSSGCASSRANRSASSAIAAAPVNRSSDSASAGRACVTSNAVSVCRSRAGRMESCASPSANRSAAEP